MFILVQLIIHNSQFYSIHFIIKFYISIILFFNLNNLWNLFIMIFVWNRDKKHLLYLRKVILQSDSNERLQHRKSHFFNRAFRSPAINTKRKRWDRCSISQQSALCYGPNRSFIGGKMHVHAYTCSATCKPAPVRSRCIFPFFPSSTPIAQPFTATSFP